MSYYDGPGTRASEFGISLMIGASILGLIFCGGVVTALLWFAR